MKDWLIFQLDKGVANKRHSSMLDANIDQYAKRLSQGIFGLGECLFKTGYQQDYNLSASAGNQNSSFIGSLGYTKQTGVSPEFRNGALYRGVWMQVTSIKGGIWNERFFSWTKNVHLPEGKFMEVPFMHQK